MPLSRAHTGWFSYIRRASRIMRTCFRNLAEITYDRARKRSRISGPERLRLMFEELGGSLLKFGQILSLQVDTLPRAYCDALLSLLDRVPPFSSIEVRRVFEEELGKAPEVLYRSFDYVPFASASIGQVHRAILVDSTVVAVKVQRPDARETFTRDAVLLRIFIRLVLLFRIRTLYFMRDPIEEFNEWVQDELDYRREATYAEAIGENANDTPAEKIPRIHWNLTTQRVLTMDYLVGYSVTDYLRALESKDQKRLSELAELGFDPGQFVSNIITNFLSDAFRHGVFHADLHPANLLILKNNVVGYVDFGIVGVLTPEARRRQIELSLAYVQGRAQDIFDAFLGISTPSKVTNFQELRRDIERSIPAWYREPAIGGIPHFQQSLTVAMMDLLRMCRTNGLLVNREMIKYIRSLMLADGLVSRLAPGLDLAPQILKVCEEYLTREARAKMASPAAALSFVLDLTGWLSAGPSRMLQILDRIDRRQLRIQTRPKEERRPPDKLWLQSALVAGSWLALTAVLATSRWRLSANAVTASALAAWAAWTTWLVFTLRRLRNYGR